MKEAITIKGRPVIDIYGTYDGRHWFITKRLENDGEQFLFGYVKVLPFFDLVGFCYLPETEFKKIGKMAWKIPKENWHLCPEFEVLKTPEEEKQVLSIQDSAEDVNSAITDNDNNLQAQDKNNKTGIKHWGDRTQVWKNINAVGINSNVYGNFGSRYLSFKDKTRKTHKQVLPEVAGNYHLPELSKFYRFNKTKFLMPYHRILKIGTHQNRLYSGAKKLKIYTGRHGYSTGNLGQSYGKSLESYFE